MGSHGHSKTPPVCTGTPRLHLWMAAVVVGVREWGDHQEWDRGLKQKRASDSGMQHLLLLNQQRTPQSHITTSAAFSYHGSAGYQQASMLRTPDPVLASHWCHINGAISSVKVLWVRSVLSPSVQGKVAQKEGHHWLAEPVLMLTGGGAQAWLVMLNPESLRWRWKAMSLPLGKVR